MSGPHTQDLRVVSFKGPTGGDSDWWNQVMLQRVDLSHLDGWLHPEIVATMQSPAVHHLFIVARKFSTATCLTLSHVRLNPASRCCNMTLLSLT